MKRSGFTLIELLVVIVIMGILAGAMVPMITANRLTAQQARVAADLDSIKTAAFMMHNDCGTGVWPTGAVSPGTLTGAGIMTAGACAVANWAGPYLDEWRNDPWGNPYRVIDNGVVVPIIRRVESWGADNLVGGTGANTDIPLRITPNIAL